VYISLDFEKYILNKKLACSLNQGSLREGAVERSGFPEVSLRTLGVRGYARLKELACTKVSHSFCGELYALIPQAPSVIFLRKCHLPPGGRLIMFCPNAEKQLLNPSPFCFLFEQHLRYFVDIFANIVKFVLDLLIGKAYDFQIISFKDFCAKFVFDFTFVRTVL